MFVGSFIPHNLSSPVTIVINVFRNLIFDWNLLIFAKKSPQKQWLFSSKTLKSPHFWVLKSYGNLVQVFFKDFVERFRTTYLKSGFLWSCFSKILLIDFRIATNLKTGSSTKYSWKILVIDCKTSTTKIIQTSQTS